MSITEIKVDSIQNIKQLIIETQKDDTIGRYRSPALFRGLPNSTYTLQTSLYRNCKEKSIELETSILRNFYKYALPTANHDSCWERMVVGQHHGLPTRLMDWSYSPLIALHFATSGEDFTAMEAHDAVVWKIDIYISILICIACCHHSRSLRITNDCICICLGHGTIIIQIIRTNGVTGICSKLTLS